MRFTFKLIMIYLALTCYAVAASKQTSSYTHHSVLIQNVSIIDVANNRIVENQHVYIEEDTIKAITSFIPARHNASIVINGEGKYLMPGLIDMHVHVFQPADLAQLLRHGITTARVMYGWPQTLTYRNKVSKGTLAGPDMIVSSPVINQKSPYANSPIHRFVDTPAQARKRVKEYAQQGFDLIKTYDGLQPEIFDAIANEAQINGLKTAGHPSFYVTMEDYLSSKPQTIEHIEMLYQAWLGYSTDRNALNSLAKELAKQNVPVTTTLVVYDNLARIAVEKHAFIDGEPTEYIHPFITKLEQSNVHHITNLDKPVKWREKADYLGLMAKVLNENGVPLVVGSDGGVGSTINGKSTLDEITLLHHYGVPANDILKAATLTPAKALNRDNEIGRVAKGFKANLLLLDNDPRKALSTLRRPVAVIKSGIVFDTDKLKTLDQQSKAHMNALDVAVKLISAF
jgi:imidazolonepropionase-like amidohydrolase